MGEIAQFQYGYTAIAGEEGEFRYIRITDINEYGNISDKDKKYVDLPDETSKEKYLLKEEDILMARIGSVGETTIFQSKEKSIFASYLIRINLNKEIILPKYYRYFTKTQEYWKQLGELTKGTVQPQFNANSLKDIRVPIPKQEEQKKIVAEFEERRKIILIQKETLDYFQKKERGILISLWQIKREII